MGRFAYRRAWVLFGDAQRPTRAPAALVEAPGLMAKQVPSVSAYIQRRIARLVAAGLCAACGRPRGDDGDAQRCRLCKERAALRSQARAPKGETPPARASRRRRGCGLFTRIGRA